MPARCPDCGREMTQGALDPTREVCMHCVETIIDDMPHEDLVAILRDLREKQKQRVQ